MLNDLSICVIMVVPYFHRSMLLLGAEYSHALISRFVFGIFHLSHFPEKGPWVPASGTSITFFKLKINKPFLLLSFFFWQMVQLPNFYFNEQTCGGSKRTEKQEENGRPEGVSFEWKVEKESDVILGRIVRRLRKFHFWFRIIFVSASR